MGALCAAIEILAAVIPFAQGLGVLGTVPMGLLAYRYRPRALMAATAAGGAIASLRARLGCLFMLVDCAWFGVLCG
ncbi:cobalt ABC transporter ATP-binding protein, partial [Mycobacterium tuberculosis]|nr:cobalt ABC transporter ATP-binding protein [Mycobacterium tuberculosis]